MRLRIWREVSLPLSRVITLQRLLTLLHDPPTKVTEAQRQMTHFLSILIPTSRFLPFANLDPVILVVHLTDGPMSPALPPLTFPLRHQMSFTIQRLLG